MNWLNAYVPLISTGISIATLLVWVFYAHLLFKTFRRNERPMILIHQAEIINQNSFCLVANLSRQPLHIVTIDLIVRTSEHEVTLRINDYERISNSAESEWPLENVLKEGPLKIGDYIALGDFRDMLEATHAADNRRESSEADRTRIEQNAKTLEIRVSAMFSSFTNPIGATRRFDVENKDGSILLEAQTPLTRQLHTRRERRQVYDWLRIQHEQERTAS